MRRTTSTLLWLLLVFASGTSVGIVGHRYFTRPEPIQGSKPPTREEIRREYLSKLRERVGVSEEQIAQIVAILDTARAESDARRHEYDTDMRSIQHRSRDQIRALLSKEQLERYDAWREERRREREKHEREKREKEKAR